jgi:type III secretory pathway lipoprotein EscJ
VEVSSRNYSSAIVLMAQNDLPRDDQSPINELIAQHGLIPNSREVEALRLDRALALELQELLAAHPAVVSAKVAVRLNFLGSSGEPAVSVVLQAAPADAVTPETVSEIVAAGVPGVKPANIKVVIQPAPASAASRAGEGAGVYRDGQAAVRVPLASFLWWRVAEGDTASITLIASISLLVMLVAGALLGYWYGFFKQGRQVIDNDLPELGPKALRIERTKRDVLLNK